MDITVKVDPVRQKDPAKAVRHALAELRPDLSRSAAVEEVFPGVTSGSRAGMVVVHLRGEISPEEYEALVKGLRERDEVIYAESAHPRKSC